MPPANIAIPANESFLRECRLLLEEVCCNLFRFRLAGEMGIAPETIRVRQECALGAGHAFADLRLEPPGRPPRFVEVKFGYPGAGIPGHIARKFGEANPFIPEGSRLTVVADDVSEADLRRSAHPSLEVELMPMAELLSRIREMYEVEIRDFTPEAMPEIRAALDASRGRHAFGDEWCADELQSHLVWHFGHHRLHTFRSAGRSADAILPPGVHRNVIVLLADLCAFSSYVRDTRDASVIAHALTAFYSRARYAIQSSGGMFYQFVGDEAIGLWGIPQAEEGDADRAYQCAHDLLEISASISNEWQRQLDRIQAAQGAHVGIATGDLQVMPMQPFSRARLSFVGESINLGARLLAAGGPSEIVASNSFHRALGSAAQTEFTPTEPIEAKNLGRINAWRARLA